MEKKVSSIVDSIFEELKELNQFIFENPELGFDEHKSSKAHVELLKKKGFEVTENFLGFDTGFKAEYDSGKEGPVIAYMAEYDALPDIGHGCGHNILGTASTGSGIVLKEIVEELGGKVVVMGTPAEETSGAKVEYVNKGAFDDVDIALMAHPADDHYESGSSLALEAIRFTFRGQTAHAAAAPTEGINALDACINTFNNINALREHIRPDARVHGVITEGGKAANIVPDLAIADFYVRATTKAYLEELREKVKNCARGAALAAGAEIEIENYEASYDNMVTNRRLQDIYNQKLYGYSEIKIKRAKESYGSLDAGNVSHVCPTIHPYFKISNEKVVGHTREFASASVGQTALNEMKNTIGALVLTAVEVIKNEDLLAEIKKEFENTSK